MVRRVGWSGCGSSPTVLPSRIGIIIGRQPVVTFESKLTVHASGSLASQERLHFTVERGRFKKVVQLHVWKFVHGTHYLRLPALIVVRA